MEDYGVYNYIEHTKAMVSRIIRIMYCTRTVCGCAICSHFKKRTFPMTETSGFLVRTIFVVVEK